MKTSTLIRHFCLTLWSSEMLASRCQQASRIHFLPCQRPEATCSLVCGPCLSSKCIPSTPAPHQGCVPGSCLPSALPVPQPPLPVSRDCLLFCLLAHEHLIPFEPTASGSVGILEPSCQGSLSGQQTLLAPAEPGLLGSQGYPAPRLSFLPLSSHVC